MKRTKKNTTNPKDRAETLKNLLDKHRELDAAITAAEDECRRVPSQARHDEILKQKRRKCILKTRIERFKKLCGQTYVTQPDSAADLPTENVAASEARPNNQPAVDELVPVFRSRRAA